jgi:hypothetical protein
MQMSKLTRRSIVASAALPALAVPAAAIAATTPTDFDKAAMIRRAEELVELFSTRYIREGWHENFDKARAAEFLENVRSFNMAAQDTEHEAKIFAWTQDHGVSLDWLLEGDHKVLITYRACRAAAFLNEPDPIFAAIERWKELDAIESAAFDAREAAIAAFDGRRLPVSHFTEKGRQFFEANVLPAMKAQVKASDDCADATKAVFATVPTTLAGMRAKIDFAFSVDYVSDLLLNATTERVVQNFLETLYQSAHLIALQS